jgi:CRISPR system Cascade subunit CasD
MGKPREDLEIIKKLSKIKMGVRVDRQGIIKKDFHTAGGCHLKKDSGYGVITANSNDRRTVTSDRFYLSDAYFLVALQGEFLLLREIQTYLANPVWQLYLGRKAFVPGLPVFLKDGLLPDCDDLDAALKGYPHLLPHRKDPSEKLRLEIETDFGKGDRVKQDQPVSFVSSNRRFTLRHVEAGEVLLKDLPPAKEESCIYLS